MGEKQTRGMQSALRIPKRGLSLPLSFLTPVTQAKANQEDTLLHIFTRSSFDCIQYTTITRMAGE